MVAAAIIAACVALLAVAGEWLHARRVRRIAFLAFGSSGRPRPWTAAAPALRVAGVAAAVFGGVLLVLYEPALMIGERLPQYSRRLLLCLDVSPSMLVEDAGPNQPRTSRARWAYRAIEPLLNAVDTATDSRITLIAFYSRAKPILVDTHDRNVVANVLDGLELWRAFEAGQTDLVGGVNAALSHAASWARGSATLVVISDGDSNETLAKLDPKPPSIAETIVVGVGDIARTSAIGDRRTRQDATSLRAVASRLGGTYIDCNRSVVPPRIAGHLSMRAPSPPVDRLGRNIGLVCVGAGSFLIALTGPALLRFGRAGRVERAEGMRSLDAVRADTARTSSSRQASPSLGATT